MEKRNQAAKLLIGLVIVVFAVLLIGGLVGGKDLLFRLDLIRRTVLVALLVIGVQYNVEVLLALLVAYNVLNGLVVSYLAGRLIGCNLWQQAGYVLGTPFYYLTKLRQKL